MNNVSVSKNIKAFFTATSLGLAGLPAITATTAHAQSNHEVTAEGLEKLSDYAANYLGTFYKTPAGILTENIILDRAENGNTSTIRDTNKLVWGVIQRVKDGRFQNAGDEQFYASGTKVEAMKCAVMTTQDTIQDQIDDLRSQRRTTKNLLALDSAQEQQIELGKLASRMQEYYGAHPRNVNCNLMMSRVITGRLTLQN